MTVLQHTMALIYKSCVQTRADLSATVKVVPLESEVEVKAFGSIKTGVKQARKAV